MAFGKVKIEGEEIIAEKIVEVRFPVNELSDYLLKYGFKHDGTWYFRKTWMGPDLFNVLEQTGLVKKVGVPNHLIKMGIRIPQISIYTKATTTSVYKIADDKLNSLIPNQK